MSDTDVVVLPSPAFVGVIAVTSISFASGRLQPLEHAEVDLRLVAAVRLDLVGEEPGGSAISAIGRSSAAWAISSDEGMCVANSGPLL